MHILTIFFSNEPFVSERRDWNKQRKEKICGKIGIVQQANSYSHEMLAREKKKQERHFYNGYC